MPRDPIFPEEFQPIRINPLTGNSVIVSTQRMLRQEKKANVVAYSGLPDYADDCPFCLGHEEDIPPILSESGNSHPGEILARGCANLYPFLWNKGRQINVGNGFFSAYTRSGVGAHELIIELPKHNGCLTCASDDQIIAVFEVMAQRYYELKGNTQFKYFYSFKNYGPGASKDHPHWQLEAREFAPYIIYEKCRRMKGYRDENNECLLCRLWQEEKQDGRAVVETDNFISYVPHAPSEPYELMILPKDHFPSFASCLEDKKLSFEFAKVMRESMLRVKKALQGDGWEELSDPPHILCLYTAPYAEDGSDSYYHWHLDFLPFTTIKVGHERGLGEDIIPVLPKDIAAKLRAV